MSQNADTARSRTGRTYWLGFVTATVALGALAASSCARGGDGNEVSGTAGSTPSTTVSANSSTTASSLSSNISSSGSSPTSVNSTTSAVESAETSVEEGEEGDVVRPGVNGSFVSPSGNISCVISETYGVSCHVSEHDWVIEAPTEVGCEYDWGNEVGLGSDGVTYGCYSDVFWDLDAEVLPYGSAMVVGGFECQSERTGVTCFNDAGDGVAISRANLEIY